MSKVISSTNQSHCKTLVQQFQQVVSEYPNEPALRFVDDNVSYRELDTRSDVIANWLQGQSIAPGMRVGLYQDRHPRFIASILGILKVGAAYVPLDRTFPENRLSFMVEDCQPSLILADDDAQNALPARTFSVIEASSGNATDFEPVDISPD
ncbi:MAG: AMP-binding protein, partial [Planctomycetales bacterium]|nr:AMP-binding protein [Planctomycetales bacterium]